MTFFFDYNEQNSIKSITSSLIFINNEKEDQNFLESNISEKIQFNEFSLPNESLEFSSIIFQNENLEGVNDLSEPYINNNLENVFFNNEHKTYFKKEMFKISPKEKENEKDALIINKPTNENSSFQSPINPIKKIFETKPLIKIRRIDYAKKHFKAYFSKFLKRYANALIKNSNLPLDFKMKKIYFPNYNSFTGNPKEKDNYIFLSFPVKKIFTYIKKGEKNINLQIKNEKLINEIFKYIEYNNVSHQFKNIIKFFNLNLEQAYELFYESEEFKQYSSSPKTFEHNEEFKRQKGFSLLEKNAFIRLVKMGKK